ncbi:MAG: hypothetical protein KGN84_20555 [Acidobacteriota bacterium]|nr:hypothetical protein [Acidobacteriota bacterium]
MVKRTLLSLAAMLAVLLNGQCIALCAAIPQSMASMDDGSVRGAGSGHACCPHESGTQPDETPQRMPCPRQSHGAETSSAVAPLFTGGFQALVSLQDCAAWTPHRVSVPPANARASTLTSEPGPVPLFGVSTAVPLRI